MRRTLLLLLSSTGLVAAQFGVPNNRRQAGTNFQDLQELAKKKAADGGGSGEDMAASMEELMKQIQDDPDYMKQFGDSMSQFGDVMEQMMKMSPDELAAQMEEAMKVFTDGDMVDNVLSQKEAVLQSLESSGVVSVEELEKFKTDSNYFEEKMRESFSQMGELFNNPEYINKATEVMQEFGKMAENPLDAMKDLAGLMGAQFDSDEKIEELRQQLLSEDFDTILPGMKDMFASDEIQAMLKDPAEFRDLLKGGPLDPAKLEL